MTIQLFNDDCLQVLRTLPDNSVDLVLTSPPYDNLRNYGGKSQFVFDKTANQLGRVLKQGGVIVWIVGDQTKNGCESLSSFKQAIYFVENVGLNLYDTMIYQRWGLPLSHRRYEQEFEYMFVFCKGKPKTFNPLTQPSKYAGIKKSMKCHSASTTEINSKLGKPIDAFIIKDQRLRGNIWRYAVGANQSTRDKIAFQRPAIFPEPLATDHILSWSNEGDLVLDPFAGSGTTLKIASQLRRDSIGIEINHEYCELIKQRIEAAAPAAQNQVTKQQVDPPVKTEENQMTFNL